MLDFVRKDWEDVDSWVRQAISLRTQLLVAEEEGYLSDPTFEGVGENEKRSQAHVEEGWEEIAMLVPLQYHNNGQILENNFRSPILQILQV